MPRHAIAKIITIKANDIFDTQETYHESAEFRMTQVYKQIKVSALDILQGLFEVTIYFYPRNIFPVFLYIKLPQINNDGFIHIRYQRYSTGKITGDQESDFC